MSTSTTPNHHIIEHVVLFKAKPSAEPTRINAMVNGLNSLTSLNQVLHLTAGPLLRTRSQSLSFTHILHTRYKSKTDLAEYSAHPSHVGVVNEFVKPIVDDIMAFDWVNDDVTCPVVVKPGSAMRVSLLKLKEGLEENEKEKILGVIGGLKSKFGLIDQLSFGENFSPDRAKGYSIGSIGVFPGLSELEELDSNAELVNEQKEKVRDLLDSVLKGWAAQWEAASFPEQMLPVN
ncbi:unnamed protein product [Ilex paraguariensis]|uniref:Stress-response A/B barrel domain-containing protein n=1 Tax=Ilex paraguariensis TaxID=185542 RepID=A0ABC8R7N6_9AQUA